MAKQPQDIPGSLLYGRAQQLLGDVRPFNFPTQFAEVFSGENAGSSSVCGER